MTCYRRHVRFLRNALPIPFLVTLLGCIANPAPVHVASDLSKPLPAAMTFLHAIDQCDVETARAVSLGTEQDKAWIDAMTSLITGLRSYEQALVQRFGQPAVPMQVNIMEALSEFTTQPVVRYENGLVETSGEGSAQVVAAMGKQRLAAEPPIPLRRVKGAWKVDLTGMRQDPRHDPSVVAKYRTAGDGLQRAAKAIRAGRYRTLEEAELAVGDQIPG